MVYFWIFIFLGMVISYRLQRLAVGNVIQRNQYRLYELRDDLRLAAIHKRVNPRNWVFQYLDSSITKMISVMDDLNVWRAIAVWFSHKRNQRIEVANQHLQHSLTKDENKELREFYLRYVRALTVFTIERHSLIRFVLTAAFISGHAAQRIKGWWNTIAVAQTEAPETSTLHDFVKA